MDENNNIHGCHYNVINKHVSDYFYVDERDDNDRDLILNNNLYVFNDNDNDYWHDLHVYKLFTHCHDSSYVWHYFDVLVNYDNYHDLNCNSDIGTSSNYYEHHSRNSDCNPGSKSMCNRVCCIWF